MSDHAPFSRKMVHKYHGSEKIALFKKNFKKFIDKSVKI